MTLFKNSDFILKEDFFERIVGLCPDAIIGINRQGVVTIFNEAAENMTGWKREEVLGKMMVTRFYHPPVLARVVKKMMYSPERSGVGQVKNMEVTVTTRDGHTVPIMLSAVLLFENGVEVGSVGFFHDLTRTRQLEEISITDDLTGLHNRHHFQSVLESELERSLRYNRPLTLLYVDIDDFKPFNDKFGHIEGDQVLRLVGKCARQLLRTQDDAFRLGGDEFALLLVETDLESGVRVAERFHKSFNEQWFKTMTARGKGYEPISLSLGVAEYHNQHGMGLPIESADDFVGRADMAMYAAKRTGGANRVGKAPPYNCQKKHK